MDKAGDPMIVTILIAILSLILGFLIGVHYVAERIGQMAAEIVLELKDQGFI